MHSRAVIYVVGRCTTGLLQRRIPWNIAQKNRNIMKNNNVYEQRIDA